jgi:hypothetical protein
METSFSQAALTALGVPQAMTARLINAFGQPYAFGVVPPTAVGAIFWRETRAKRPTLGEISPRATEGITTADDLAPDRRIASE